MTSDTTNYIWPGFAEDVFCSKKTIGEITMTEESTRKMKPWMKLATRLSKNSYQATWRSQESFVWKRMGY